MVAAAAAGAKVGMPLEAGEGEGAAGKAKGAAGAVLVATVAAPAGEELPVVRAAVEEGEPKVKPADVAVADEVNAGEEKGEEGGKAPRAGAAAGDNDALQSAKNEREGNQRVR